MNERPRSSSVGKARRKSKKSMRAAAEGGDDGEPKIQRKRKRKQPVEVDLSELPPEQGRFDSRKCKMTFEI